MSGHSKWSKIKRQKGKEDQKRGAVFSKLARAITLATAKGESSDPGKNAALRVVLAKARAANMPKSNIERAVAKALKKGEGTGLEQVTFEGYGPAGVAVVVKVETDNRRRAIAEVKNLFERGGGSLGSPGSATFMFEHRGGELVPQSRIMVSGSNAAKVRQFLKALGDHDDVTEVVHTAQFEANS